MTFYGFILLLFSLLNHSKLLASQESVFGYVYSIRGRAIVKNASGSRELKEKDRVHVSDVIQTGEKSFVTIETPTKDQFQVFPESEMEIPARSSTSSKTSVLKMVSGSLRFFVKKIKRKAGETERYQIQTQAAVMGIRGTQGFVFVLRNRDVRLFVLSGVVNFKPLQSKAPSFDVGPKQLVSISITTAKVEPPRRVSVSEIRQQYLKDVPKSSFVAEKEWILELGSQNTQRSSDSVSTNTSSKKDGQSIQTQQSSEESSEENDKNLFSPGSSSSIPTPVESKLPAPKPSVQKTDVTESIPSPPKPVTDDSSTEIEFEIKTPDMAN